MAPEPIDPNIADRNAQNADLVAKLTALDSQIEALGEKAQEKRRELRTAFREANNARFADVDYRRALIGAKTEHSIAIKEVVAFFVRPPSSAVTHAVDKFISEPTVPDAADVTKAINLGPVSEAERALLGWMTAVHLLADPTGKRQEVDQLPPGRRLQMLRGLPEDLIRRVAEEAALMRDWLNVVLEIELGNF